MTEPVDTTLPAASPLADLVCADPELLRAEFDSIIAANYPTTSDRLDPRPPRHPPSGAAGYPPWPVRPRRRAASPGEPGGPDHLRQLPRQRGPPRRAHPPAS